MKVDWKSWTVLAVALAAVGCARVQTRLVEMPRVDQELGQSSGNRGYLSGKAGDVGPRKTTRQVVMTDVELATGQEIKSGIKRRFGPVKGEVGPQGRGYRETQQQVAQVAPTPVRATPTPIAPIQPAEIESEYDGISPIEIESSDSIAATAESTYVVQKGDNLEKIAKKVYGNSKRWPKIYNANRTALKNNPNRLYPGQKLSIPSLPSEAADEQQQASAAGDLK